MNGERTPEEEDYLQCLRERRDWLTERAKAKTRVRTTDGKGWDNNYDLRERDATDWALRQLGAE